MDEDLNHNLFFKTIKFKFPKVFNTIESKCYTLCIPQFTSIYGMNITQKVVESHVFIESKYFMGEYETLNKESNYIIENGYVILKDKSSKKVKILFDELCYNKDFKSYKLICIEEPLVGGNQNGNDGINNNNNNGNNGNNNINNKSNRNSVMFRSESDMDLGSQLGVVKPEKPTFEQSNQFFLLDSISTNINTIVFRKANQQLEEFESCHSIRSKNDIELFVRDLVIIHNRVLDDLVCANAEYKQLQSHEKQMNNLSLILESYIMGKIHSKIYGDLKKVYERENQQLYEKMIYLSKLSLEDIGIKIEFEPHLNKALEVINTFGNEYISSANGNSNASASTPMDKLLTIIQASKEIEESIKARSILELVDQDNVLTITGDDALPLTAYLLICARPKHLATDLVYCSEFIITDIFSSSFGYHLVNFTAAIDYIKSLDILSTTNTTTGGSKNTSPTSSTSNISYGGGNSSESLVAQSTISINNLSIHQSPQMEDEAAIYNNFKKSNSVFNLNSPIQQQQQQRPISPLAQQTQQQPPFLSNNNNSQFQSTPNLLNNNHNNGNKYSTVSFGNNSNSTNKYVKAPSVISLNDEDDDNNLGDFIGKLRDMKDDEVIVSSTFK